MKRVLAIFAAAAVWITLALPADAQTAPACQFILGFKSLHDLDPGDIGDCIDNQTFAGNGDAQQHTTKGLMAWRKADNWTAFTNGYMTWINGPNGLVRRLNTDRFPWESAAVPAGPSDPCGGPSNPWGFTDCRRASAVDTFSGGWLYGHTDFVLDGSSPNLLFRRSYNSWDTRSVASLSEGWTDNYAANLARAGDATSDIILDGPEGRSDRYTLNPDGSYTPPPAVYTTLVKNADQTYTATLSNKATWTFNGAGRLTRVTDTSGKQSLLAYNGGGELISVSDPAGRGSLTFTYTTPGSQLASVSDWSSTSPAVQFGYDSHGRLHLVTTRDGETITYGYEGDSSRITTIADLKAGAVVISDYDAQGRVQKQSALFGLQAPQLTRLTYVANPDGGETTTIVYSPDPGTPTVAQTVVETFDSSGRIVSRTSNPSPTRADSFSYDGNFNRISVTNDQGTTTFCYDSDYSGAKLGVARGDLTRRIDPASTPDGSRPVTLFKYNANNALVEIIPPQAVHNGANVNCSTDLSALVDESYIAKPT